MWRGDLSREANCPGPVALWGCRARRCQGSRITCDVPATESNDNDPSQRRDDEQGNQEDQNPSPAAHPGLLDDLTQCRIVIHVA